ncbi:MAG TPA: VWA domain-containing protein [Pirellulales bacterium]|nr:VWA domain-containing protein [Pirellulales bacterium]
MSLRHLIRAILSAAAFCLLFQRVELLAGAEPNDPPAGRETEFEPESKAKAGPAKKPRAKADSAIDKEFRTAQRSALSQMKSKKIDLRAEAFEKLKDYPTADCAKLLVLQGMTSPYEDVRKQAYATLTSFRDSEDVCNYLLASVEKDSSRGTPNETTCALFAVPLASESPEIEKRAFDLFDKAAGQRRGGMLMLVSMIDQLGAVDDADNVPTLVRISKRPIFNQQFGIRRSVVQALTKITEKSAVDALVEILGKAEGEVRVDIVQHLSGISGQRFGVDPAAWDTWWKANRKNFKFPGLAARAANRAEAIQGRSMYYGLPIYAARLLFVIDTSKSMHGERIYAAKRELISAINALPDGVYFDVLAFDRGVRPWQRKLAIASAENKKKATGWVGGISDSDLGPATASYDALEAALDFDTESVFFLTDGKPAGGKIDNPIEIVEVISRLNFTRRITINAIGIGVGPALPTNLFHEFLSTLAERNYGEYKPVNQ